MKIKIKNDFERKEGILIKINAPFASDWSNVWIFTVFSKRKAEKELN